MFSCSEPQLVYDSVWTGCQPLRFLNFLIFKSLFLQFFWHSGCKDASYISFQLTPLAACWWLWHAQVWYSNFSLISSYCCWGGEAGRGTASAELFPLPSAYLQCLLLPRSAGTESKAAQFLCVAADSHRFQNSSCEKAVFGLLLCGGNSEQQERQSVCMWVPGCISLGLCFEGYFHSRKHWRLFIFCLKFSRSWWYLPKRIYFWFLFILQRGDKAYASLQACLLVCISLRMFLSVFPVRKGKSIN